MKLKFTFISILLLLSGMISAQISPVGHLTVFSESGDRFFLILNGEQQNDIAQTNLRIEDLNQPYYNAKIVFADKAISEISKNYLPITDADGVYQDVTYKVKKDKNNRSKMKLNFFSMIPVRPEYTPPANVYVMHYGQPQLNMNSNANVNVGVNMNVNINESVTEGSSSNHHQNDNYDNANHHPRGCHNAYPMAQSNFNSALATIKKQNFEDAKLKTVQQIVSSNCVDTNQISQLAQLFNFEDNKLDFAKFAYDFCVDPENYFKLNTLFNFSSNSEALSDYVQSKR